MRGGAASIQCIRRPGHLRFGDFTLRLDVPAIVCIDWMNVPGFHSISAARTHRLQRRHVQAIHAGRVRDDGDRLTTPFDIWTIDAVRQTAVRIDDGQHHVDAALADDDRNGLARPEIDYESVPLAGRERFPDRSSGVERDRILR